MADKPSGKPPAKAPAPAASPWASVSAPKTAEIVIAIVLLLAALPLLSNMFFPPEGGGAVATALSSLIETLKMISTVVSMAALVVAVYAYFKIQDITAEEKRKLGLVLNWSTERKQKNVRWERVEKYMLSANPSDWKIAILEADNMLDEIVERMGYKGATLGERMKTIEASDFPYLDETWQAHKLRNAIAHKGTDYPLTKSEADQAITTYHRVFKESGYIA